MSTRWNEKSHERSIMHWSCLKAIVWKAIPPPFVTWIMHPLRIQPCKYSGATPWNNASANTCDALELPPTQDAIVTTRIIPFLVGNPKLNLHLWLASWVAVDRSDASPNEKTIKPINIWSLLRRFLADRWKSCSVASQLSNGCAAMFRYQPNWIATLENTQIKTQNTCIASTWIWQILNQKHPPMNGSLHIEHKFLFNYLTRYPPEEQRW